jgi:hypothetical protein
MRGINNEYIPLLTTHRDRYHRTMDVQFRDHFKRNLLYHTEKCSNTKTWRGNIHNLRIFEAMTQNIFHFYVWHIYPSTARILMRWWSNNKAKASELLTLWVHCPIYVSVDLYFIGTYVDFFLWRCDPTRVMASSFLRFLSHTTTHLSR